MGMTKDRRMGWGLAIGIVLAMFGPTLYAVGVDSGNTVGAHAYQSDRKFADGYFYDSDYTEDETSRTYAWTWGYVGAWAETSRGGDVTMRASRAGVSKFDGVVLWFERCTETYSRITREYDWSCDSVNLDGPADGFTMKTFLGDARYEGTLTSRDDQDCPLQVEWTGGALGRGAFAYPEVRQHFAGLRSGASMYRDAEVKVTSPCLEGLAPQNWGGGYLYSEYDATAGASQELTPTVEP